MRTVGVKFNVRHFIIMALSLGLTISGCGHPLIREDTSLAFITESDAFRNAETALARQGVSVSELIASGDGAFVFRTSSTNTVLNVLVDRDQVLSATIFFVEGNMLTISNPGQEMAITVLLDNWSADTNDWDGDVAHELANVLGLGIATEFEVQCAACDVERNARNAAAASLALASAGYALAVASLASCGAVVTAPACVAALAAYATAQASLALASAQWASAQSALDRCLRERC